MNMLELIRRFRRKADDMASRPKWSDEELIEWYAEAEEEACERGRLIRDDRTIAMDSPSAPTLTATTGTLNDATYSYKVSAVNASGETLASTATTLAVVLGAASNGVVIAWTAVTGATNYKVFGRTGGSELLIATVGESTLTYTDTGSVTPSGAQASSNTTEDVVKVSIKEGQVHYALHTSIVEITRAYITDGTDDYVLDATFRKTLDAEYPDWRNSTERPSKYIHDDESIRLNTIPAEDFTLMLEVRRKPLSAMSEATASVSPEIDVKHHKHLVYYVLWQAYDCRDVDKYSPQRAEKNEKLFTRYFGYPQDSDHRRRQEADRPHRVTCHW